MRDYSYDHKRVTFNVAFSGIFFGLILIFQFISQFMKYGVFLDINLSIIFIIIVFYVIDYKYVIGLLVLRSLISPAFSGYTIIAITGQMILLVSNLIFIFVFIFIHILLIKKTRKIKVKSNLIISFFSATAINAILMSVLNGLLFVPLYFFILKIGNTINFIFYLNNWLVSKYDALFFFAPTYWSGMFTYIFSFNIINYAIVSVISILIIIVFDNKYIFLSSRFNSNKKVKSLNIKNNYQNVKK